MEDGHIPTSEEPNKTLDVVSAPYSKLLSDRLNAQLIDLKELEDGQP